MEQGALRHLVRAARRLTAERDQDRALASAVSVARDMTGARHSALAVLDPAEKGIARLIAATPDVEGDDIEEVATAAAALHEEVINRPLPIRRAGPGEASGSGEAPAQPSTGSLLAVPIMVDARPWGYFYLADADAGEFSKDDEEAVLVLSALASIAVAHTDLLDRLPATSEEARREPRRAEAIIAMSRLLDRDSRLQEVVELIAQEGQQFVEARALVVLLPIGDELEAVSAAVDTAPPTSGFSLPLPGALADPVFYGLRAAYLQGDPRPEEVGLRRWLGARSGLLVPLVFVGEAVGMVAAFDPLSGAAEFGPEDERLLRSFGEAAAAAIVTARLAQAERARRHAAEHAREGGRLAQDLHDETLQALGMLRLSLSSALEGEKKIEALEEAVEAAIRRLDQEIEELRRLIDELRPAVLHALGLEAALGALADNAAAEGNLEVETDISLDGGTGQLPAEIEHALYRTAQEALTNVVKHADASRVELDLHSDADAIELRIADDGRGIGARPGRIGFGLLAMRERVESAGGRFELTTSAAGGTTVRAAFATVREPSPTQPQQASERTPHAPEGS